MARPKIGTKLRRNHFLCVHNSTNLSRSSSFHGVNRTEQITSPPPCQPRSPKTMASTRGHKMCKRKKGSEGGCRSGEPRVTESWLDN